MQHQSPTTILLLYQQQFVIRSDVKVSRPMVSRPIFSARQHSIAHYMLSPVRLSVRPTEGWIIEKRLKLEL